MRNSIKEKLVAGEVVFGQMVMEFFTPGLPYLLARHGLDYALFDMEHGRCDLALLSEMVFASRAAGIAPFVRVPDVAFAPLSRVLDIGVAGVMVPRVETPEQMRSIVSALKYAPEGKRGVALGFAHDDYHSRPAYLAQANDVTLVIALFETAAAFDRLDEIVTTPGLDVAGWAITT
ncbi:MAG: aldolase/citrate lyase family protein [Bryobacteraceae bacterium]